MTRPTPRDASRRRLVAAAAALPVIAALPHAARAQARFPERPITIVVPFGPGGIADLTARAVGEHMATTLGQSVVIDNKPSAGGIVAAQAVTSARPDGHTLLLMSNANAVSVGLFKKLPYDPVKDFAPVGTLGYFDLGIFVPANSRFATLADMVAFAKANPGKLNVGTIAIGSTQHLSAKLFETVAGIEALVVPYKASPAVLTALRAGEIDVAFEIVGPMMPQVSAGAVKALAVTSSQRNAALRDVPTVAQAGVAGYDVASWNALAAPAGTPAAVIDALNKAARDAIATPSVREKLGKLGMRLAASSPAELQALLTSEIKRWGDVIRAAKIEPE
ncbi:tripartite tricarboxylate transporter substrate binding protein [Calidifontimicrobium sp. SYSU G02091]|uniref:Bug family tripartite tricarboxylate transporter substrate binding protein n=1 Tax=Calidifontimicrobium sp. SYSU G02091 TaxID=2926421 RepID=UPI001F531B6F|nr:tripartite tricarboxylate transporter substrate binding protein [Calidifontimicrobium sp. SYSU G02091]MCI1193814.1 tripartite tricarboxylate transporter substrate binding protein [Calidifontimicrobium sp. SYSU G02091]